MVKAKTERVYRSEIMPTIWIGLFALSCLFFFVIFFNQTKQEEYLFILGIVFFFYLVWCSFFMKVIVDEKGIVLHASLWPWVSQPRYLGWSEIKLVRSIDLSNCGLSLTRGQDELHFFQLLPKDSKKKAIRVSGATVNIRQLLQNIVNHLPPDAQVDPNVIKFINSPYDRREYLKITAWIVGIFALGFGMLYVASNDLKAEREKIALSKQIQTVDQLR